MADPIAESILRQKTEDQLRALANGEDAELVSLAQNEIFRRLHILHMIERPQ